MKIVVWTPDFTEEFNCDIANLLQLKNYLQYNNEKIYKFVTEQELTYTVLEKETANAIPLIQEMVKSDISGYDTLIIAPKIYGEMFFSALVTALTASLGVVGANIVAAVITIGVVIGLGMLMQMLTPNNEIDGQDPAEVSRIFNGVPNITEQGGSVPIVCGNCLFGGVRIGSKLEVTQEYTNITYVNSMEEAMSFPSKWIHYL